MDGAKDPKHFQYTAFLLQPCILWRTQIAERFSPSLMGWKVLKVTERAKGSNLRCFLGIVSYMQHPQLQNIQMFLSRDPR